MGDMPRPRGRCRSCRMLDSLFTWRPQGFSVPAGCGCQGLDPSGSAARVGQSDQEEEEFMAGLYRPEFEHDACGVNFVADIKGRRSHRIVSTAIGAVGNMVHRGATGADLETGDGAGVLIQVPDRFLRAVVPFDLPPMGHYAAGLAFFPAGLI